GGAADGRRRRLAHLAPDLAVAAGDADQRDHPSVSRGSSRSGNGFAFSSRTKPTHSSTASSSSASPLSAVAAVASPWTPVRENDDHHGISFSGPSDQSIQAYSPAG